MSPEDLARSIESWSRRNWRGLRSYHRPQRKKRRLPMRRCWTRSFLQTSCLCLLVQCHLRLPRCLDRFPNFLCRRQRDHSAHRRSRSMCYSGPKGCCQPLKPGQLLLQNSRLVHNWVYQPNRRQWTVLLSSKVVPSAPEQHTLLKNPQCPHRDWVALHIGLVRRSRPQSSRASVDLPAAKAKA